MTTLDSLCSTPKKAARILSNQQYFQTYSDPGPLPTSTPLLKNLGILKLIDIFKSNIVKFVPETRRYESTENYKNNYSTTSSSITICSKSIWF